jgi:Flp pilus assembly secretin CpaC
LSEIEVYYSGTGVILRGEVQSSEEATRIASLVQGFPQAVRDETEPSDALLQRAQTQLEAWLSHSPYAHKLQVVREDKSLFIHLTQGSIGSPSERTRIEKHAQSIFALVQTDLDSLPDASPTVHFKVYLLELKKTKFHSLGLGWPALQEGAFRVTTSAIQDMVQLDLALQILEGDGSVKILSNPELVVRAPGDAELFSGGEIPIESKSAYFSAITWKSFGLLLQLHVTHSAGDRVRLDILTEVSHLDPQIAVGKVPGLQANRMKTQVDAQYGRPLLLSGLLQQNLRTEARGLPALRNIPVLGALFGSEDYLNEKSELVAILVPSNELPKNPMERITRILPKGPMPSSRVPADPAQERALQESSNYPWNVLE